MKIVLEDNLMAQIAQRFPDVAQSATQKKGFRWSWSKIKEDLQQSSTSAQLARVQPTNFYERAIEWTHRADKIINLVLGYLLAIASVLGFMDVLSNGQVLNQVPFMFYVWLAIMGLGVDFQILLVIGRIPDLFRMPVAGWQKWLIFLFNVLFLVFLCVMSIATSAIFTQHRDMPLITGIDPFSHLVASRVSTIDDAMGVLGINSILFVYGRAALATLLLVLMAVDRTMERWRMQIIATNQHKAQDVALAQSQQVQIQQPQQEASQPAPVQASDLDKILQAVVAMNQQNLQLMQDMNRQTIEQVSQMSVQLTEETLNRFATTILFPGSGVPSTMNQMVQDIQHADHSSSISQMVQDIQHVDHSPSISQMMQDFQGSENSSSTEELFMDLSSVTSAHTNKHGAMAFDKNYSAKIEALLQQEPDLGDREIAARVGCSLRTASRWKSRVQQSVL